MRPNDREGNDRFAEILIARLEASEPVTQFDIARRLATCPETPRTLLEWFTREESLACDFLLEHGVGLTEADLRRAVAAACGVPARVAKRRFLSGDLVEALSLFRSYDVHLNLARNTQAALEGSPLVRLLRAARARRPGITTVNLPRLFCVVALFDLSMPFSSSMPTLASVLRSS